MPPFASAGSLLGLYPGSGEFLYLGLEGDCKYFQLCGRCCSGKAATEMSGPGREPEQFNYKNRQQAGFGLWAVVCQPLVCGIDGEVDARGCARSCVWEGSLCTVWDGQIWKQPVGMGKPVGCAYVRG